MNRSRMATTESHLVVHRRAAVPPERVAWAVREARAWLGPEVGGAPDGMRRYETDLRLRVSDNPPLVTLRKAAYVDLGPIEPLNDGWQVEISWRAATLAPLFPVFFGLLLVHGDELTLSGWYAPPGGELGRLADRALLHIAAKGTARWLLGEIEQASRGP